MGHIPTRGMTSTVKIFQGQVGSRVSKEKVQWKTRCCTAVGSSRLLWLQDGPKERLRLSWFDYLAPCFPGPYYTFLIDSEPVEGALVKGSSGYFDITSGAGIFCDMCLRYDLKAYLSRISSESNLSDAPSRADFMFLQEAGSEWVDLKPSPEVLDFAKWDEIVDDRLPES